MKEEERELIRKCLQGRGFGFAELDSDIHSANYGQVESLSVKVKVDDAYALKPLE